MVFSEGLGSLKGLLVGVLRCLSCGFCESLRGRSLLDSFFSTSSRVSFSHFYLWRVSFYGVWLFLRWVDADLGGLHKSIFNHLGSGCCLSLKHF